MTHTPAATLTPQRDQSIDWLVAVVLAIEIIAGAGFHH
jgi:hypothetical protein